MLSVFCCCFQISLRDVVLRILLLFTTIKNVITEETLNLGDMTGKGCCSPWCAVAPHKFPWTIGLHCCCMHHLHVSSEKDSLQSYWYHNKALEYICQRQEDKGKKIKPVTVSIFVSEKSTACLNAHRKIILLQENLTGSQTGNIKEK